MKKKIGIAVEAFQKMYGDKRALEIAAEIGADAVDFSTFSFDGDWDYRNPKSIYAEGDEAIRQYYGELKAHADSLGIIIGQTHGRGNGFFNDKERDDAEIENARLDLLAASALGAKICVMHNATSINHGTNPDPALMRRLSFEQFTRTLPYAAQYGVKLATETFGDAVRFNSVDFFGDIREFLMTFNRIEAASPYREYWTMCVDTGHTNKASRFGNPKVGDVIRMLGSRITALHLNDNDTLTDQHKIPLTGTIDWQDTLDALDEVGYQGIYNMELRLPHFGTGGFEVETAAFAVKVMRKMLEDREG